MNQKHAPEYLCNIVPPCVQSTTNYPLRYSHDIIVPFCRLSLTTESFIPSTIREWNKLDPKNRSVDSISKFKKELKNDSLLCKTETFYLYGPMKLNIILTQFLCSASFLNNDLFRANIIKDPSCHCGSDIEDVYHYFFVCPKYTLCRKTLFHNLNWLSENFVLDTKLLICGHLELLNEQNIQIFKQVQNFIKRSNRLLMPWQSVIITDTERRRCHQFTSHRHRIIRLFKLSFPLFTFSPLCSPMKASIYLYKLFVLCACPLYHTIIVTLYCIMEKTS